MSQPVQAVSNYLVPAAGTTNSLAVSDVFTPSGKFIDFNSYQLDGQSFRPSGVIVSNTNGTKPVVVRINELGVSIKCDAGATMQMPYPAPINHTVTITGDNEYAEVIFVDYPLIPNVNGGENASLTNSELRASPLEVVVNNQVSQGLTDAELRAQPLDVTLTNNIPIGLTDTELRASPLNVELPTKRATITTLNVTAAGSTPANTISAAFLNTGTTDATVSGLSLAPNETVSFEVSGYLVGSISYTASATSELQIIYYVEA